MLLLLQFGIECGYWYLQSNLCLLAPTEETRKSSGAESQPRSSRAQMLRPPLSNKKASDRKTCKMLPNTECDIPTTCAAVSACLARSASPQSPSCILVTVSLDCCSYWGEAIVWGPQNKVDSAEECCQQCANYSPASEDDMDCNGMQFHAHVLFYKSQ